MIILWKFKVINLTWIVKGVTRKFPFMTMKWIVECVNSVIIRVVYFYYIYIILDLKSK